VASLNRGFDFSAPSGVGGPVLRQMQLLPPGKYRLSGRASTGTGVADRPYWVLTCAGRELGRVPLAGGNGNAAFRGELDVPADCSVQELTLVVRPSDALQGTSGRVVRVRLEAVPR